MMPRDTATPSRTAAADRFEISAFDDDRLVDVMRVKVLLQVGFKTGAIGSVYPERVVPSSSASPKTTRSASCCPASSIALTILSRVPAKSSHTGASCASAIFRVFDMAAMIPDSGQNYVPVLSKVRPTGGDYARFDDE